MLENPNGCSACSQNKCSTSLTLPNKQQESGDHKPRCQAAHFTGIATIQRNQMFCSGQKYTHTHSDTWFQASKTYSLIISPMSC